MFFWVHEASIGPLLLAGNERGLRYLSFARSRRAKKPESSWRQDRFTFAEVTRQLDEYFAGERREFDLPWMLEGTEFQLRVWNRLARIPYGETISYGQLAREIGEPQAARAVGLANGMNPIPIVLPCHRVIGSNGRLTGFGGGLPLKKRLLELESAQMRLVLPEQAERAKA
jgi:methylated-DNA-[protein]-cysteine S-methyltransferase